MASSTKTKEYSTLTPAQQGISRVMAQYLTAPMSYDETKQAEAALTGQAPQIQVPDAPTISADRFNEYFDKGVVNPAMFTFDRVMAPRVSQAFAQGGNYFSSRRGDAMADALNAQLMDLTGKRAAGQMDLMKFNADLTRQYDIMGMQAQQINFALDTANTAKQESAASMLSNPFGNKVEAALAYLNNSQIAFQNVGGATRASGATSGALSGAMSGATIGTAVSPGWGTAIGAGIGAIAGGGAGYATTSPSR